MDKTEKFLTMCEIEKRAKVLTEQFRKEGGLTEGCSIDGYRYVGKNWREAKDAGFVKQADRQWVGFTNGGDGAYSAKGFVVALTEFRLKLPNSFLQNVYHYEYLT